MAAHESTAHQVAPQSRRTARSCSIDGCGKPIYSYGLCKMHRYRVKRTGRTDLKSDLERLMERVEKTDSDCWEYTRYRNRWGYGRLRIGRKKVLAHRASYLLHFGHLPDDALVCHRCDNPACVNPDHLFLGTNDDNMRDCHQKGRNCRGTRIWTCKLTEADVRSIRASIEPRRVLAKRYGVCPGTITEIRKFKKWRWLDG